MPSRGLPEPPPCGTGSGQWRRGKPDAPGTSAGSPAAGGRVLEGLVVEAEGDRVEPIEPEPLLPPEVLGEKDAELAEVLGNGRRHLRLLRFAVPGHALAHRLRRVGGEGDAAL